MNAMEYVRTLEAVGFSREQAEVQALGLTEVMEAKFATKDDLNNARNDLRYEIQAVRSELKAEIQQLRTEVSSEIQQLRGEVASEIHQLRSETVAEFKLVRAEMREMEGRLTIKLGSIMFGTVAFFSAFTIFMEHMIK